MSTIIQRRSKLHTVLASVGPTGLDFGERLKSFIGNDHTMSKTRTRTRTGNKKRRTRKIYRKRVPRAVQPYSIVRKLKTNFYYSLDPGTGTVASLIFGLNNAFDPTLSSGTQQGLGFDQYAALYQRYCVVGYDITFKMVTTENTNPVIVGFTPMPGYSTALTTYSHYAELPGTVQRLLTPDTDKAFMKAKGKVKPHFLPKGGKMLTDDTLSAGVTTNPSRTLYGHIYAQSMDQAADCSATKLSITVTQTVVFYVPEVNIARST